MRIEIWSDVVCPWCYIGKRRFEQALGDFPGRDEVEVVYRSFELDPRAPEQGTESVVEALGRKYGGGPAAGRAMVERVRGVAAETGLTFDFADATHSRTLDAHRLLHLALAEGGSELQGRLTEAFLAAYFTQARSMGDPAVLRETARSVGLDPVRVDEVLSSDAYADDVQDDLREARELGISGVPFYVLDRKLAVSGAQPVEVFTQALQQAWDGPRPALRVLAGGPEDTADPACGPDGCDA
jgi:predicted DsbA family dithiol-disulfide isomerase